MLAGWRPVLAFCLTLAAAPVVQAVVAPSEARAQDASDIDVGTLLVATSDVTLHRAEISKGSKVSVTKLLTRQGRTDGVAVALADGHVVKVTMSMLRSFFRIAE